MSKPKAKKPRQKPYTGVIDVPESLEAHAREQGHVTKRAIDDLVLLSADKTQLGTCRVAPGHGVLFRVMNGRAFVDATITYKAGGQWEALVRLSIDANNARHRFIDTRAISSESHEMWSSPREGILLAMLQMCVNRLGTFAEVEIAERERERLVGELMRAGFSEAARKVGEW